MTVVSALLPEGRQQFLDANGAPLVGASVFFYVPNTTTLKNTYQDSGNVTLNTNPVILDDIGSAVIYGSGQYAMKLVDASGNLIYTALTAATPLTGQFLEVDTNGNFTINVGPNLFADTTGRLIQGFNPTYPPGATYIMTDDDRGAAIGTENSSGVLTVTLPDPAVVGSGYYALFHRGVTHNMIVNSTSSNIYTTQYQTGTNSLTLPNPGSFLGLYTNGTTWAAWTGSADMSYQAGATIVYTVNQQTIPDDNDAAIIWSNVLRDALGLWDPANPTRLTVPPGVSKVRVSGNIRFSPTTIVGKFHFTLFKNGALFIGTPFLEIGTAGFSIYPAGNITSPELIVSPGDYFEFVVLQQTGGTFQTENDIPVVNWFSMEILQYGSQV